LQQSGRFWYLKCKVVFYKKNVKWYQMVNFMLTTLCKTYYFACWANARTSERQNLSADARSPLPPPPATAVSAPKREVILLVFFILRNPRVPDRQLLQPSIFAPRHRPQRPSPPPAPRALPAADAVALEEYLSAAVAEDRSDDARLA
jgi:hypothetical protein